MHIYSRHGGNLLVAENASDERSMANALKAIDPDLVLTWEQDDRYDSIVWNVHKVVSRDHDAKFICAWRENGAGRPLPLSSGLLDEVKRLRDVDTMAVIDAQNARLRERAKKQARTDALDLAADHAPYVDRNRVSVAPDSPRPKPYWQRNTHLRGAL